MAIEAIQEALKQHPFLEDFRPAFIDRLVPLTKEVTFQRDEIIFREGEIGQVFYLLLSGKVALEVSAPGKTLRVQTLVGGEELGWSAVFSAGGRQFQARALSTVKALALDAGGLREACDHDCGLGYALMKRVVGVVAERLQATRLQLLDVYSPASARGERS